jgi:hypothetical protein
MNGHLLTGNLQVAESITLLRQSIRPHGSLFVDQTAFTNAGTGIHHDYQAHYRRSEGQFWTKVSHKDDLLPVSVHCCAGVIRACVMGTERCCPELGIATPLCNNAD